MPNASNTTDVVEAIGGIDVTDQRALIAVQGPEARARLARLSPEAATVHHFAVERFEWGGATCMVAGNRVEESGAPPQPAALPTATFATM